MEKVKFIVTCDEHGVKSEPVLHYWDYYTEEWIVVPTDECKTWEYSSLIKIKED